MGKLLPKTSTDLVFPENSLISTLSPRVEMDMEQKANCDGLNFKDKTWQLLWTRSGIRGVGWGRRKTLEKQSTGDHSCVVASWVSIVLFYFLSKHYFPNFR